MKNFFYVILFQIAFCFLAISTSPAMDYILGEGDVLTVTVFEHPELNATARVSGQGVITLPLIGTVEVARLSVDSVSIIIEERLADGFIVDPQVNIFINEFRSRRATLLGEVRKQGLYELRGYTSLLELISQAGGLTDDAMDTAIIHRNPGAEQGEETIVIDLVQLMRKGRGGHNISIVNGDNIYIPRKATFYVTGQVAKPDAYNYEEGLKVIQALTMAGGVTTKAGTRRIQIIRTVNGREHLIKGVDMDMTIHPNDIIIVPESYF